MSSGKRPLSTAMGKKLNEKISSLTKIFLRFTEQILVVFSFNNFDYLSLGCDCLIENIKTLAGCTVKSASHLQFVSFFLSKLSRQPGHPTIRPGCESRSTKTAPPRAL